MTQNGDETATQARSGDAVNALDVLETELAVMVRLTEHQSRRAITYRELDRSSYLMARAMESIGPVGINTLASALRLEPTTVTRKISDMEASGIVERRVDENDKRVRIVQLSDAGRKKTAKVRGIRKGHNVALLSDWSDEDLIAFSRLLRKYNGAIAGAPASVIEHEPHASTA